MRELVKIVKVDSISPIKGADRIEVAHIGGWQCVVKKGEFTPGARGVFYEIDSFLPASDKRYAFLKERGTKIIKGTEGMRIKTMELRKTLSQGLLLPTSEFTKKELRSKDLADALGVIKYERNVPHQLRGEMRGDFPGFIQKTNQPRVQNSGRGLREHAGERFEVTIKMDGSSMTVYHRDGDVGVCSHNVNLKVYTDPRKWWEKLRDRLLRRPPRKEPNKHNAFVRLAIESGLLDMLATGDYGNVAIQGELMGPKIQGNREGFEEPMFFIFDVWDIDRQRYLHGYERFDLISDLLDGSLHFDEHMHRLANDTACKNVYHVPTLHHELVLNHTVAELLEMADGHSLNNKTREGLVFKSLDSDFTFKVISNRFLLKEES